MKKSERIVLTCEHAGNKVPEEYRQLFRAKKGLLDGHRGWDPGALDLAKALAKKLECPLVVNLTTRMLIDCNRTLGHPELFSEVSKGLGRRHKMRLLAMHYRPHWRKVEKSLAMKKNKTPVLHLGIHSFTPVLNGKKRTVDVGILYDPKRKRESDLAKRWGEALRELRPKLRVRMNQPYKGTSDGLTTALRKKYGIKRYAGLELEVNQAFPKGNRRKWSELKKALHDSLITALSPR